MAAPKTATATSSVRPTRRDTGRDGEHGRDDDGADPGCRAQPAVADVADTEAILGDRRQQGDGAAEQHGEHVEGDGAEQHGPATDEAQALHRVVEAGSLVARRARLRAAQPDRRDGDGGGGEAAGRHDVGHRRVDVVEEPAGRRPDDEAELPGSRVEGDHARQAAVGSDQRGQRAVGRGGERPRRAEQGGDERRSAGPTSDPRRRRCRRAPTSAPRTTGRWRQPAAGRSGRLPTRSVAAATAPAGTRRGRAARVRTRCR